MRTETQKQFYAENGYVLVKGMFSKEEATDYRVMDHSA